MYSVLRQGCLSPVRGEHFKIGVNKKLFCLSADYQYVESVAYMVEEKYGPNIRHAEGRRETGLYRVGDKDTR